MQLTSSLSTLSQLTGDSTKVTSEPEPFHIGCMCGEQDRHVLGIQLVHAWGSAIFMSAAQSREWVIAEAAHMCGGFPRQTELD